MQTTLWWRSRKKKSQTKPAKSNSRSIHITHTYSKVVSAYIKQAIKANSISSPIPISLAFFYLFLCSQAKYFSILFLSSLSLYYLSLCGAVLFFLSFRFYYFTFSVHMNFESFSFGKHNEGEMCIRISKGSLFSDLLLLLFSFFFCFLFFFVKISGRFFFFSSISLHIASCF